MADGLKQHTHEERERVIASLIPLIQRHAGSDLVAVAATGSFARRQDGAYSDIELIAFVGVPQEGSRDATRFIHDGMLIDIWYLTSKEYLEIHKGGRRDIWPYAATSTLVAVLNESFVREVAAKPWQLTAEECLAALKELWPEVQEAAAKLLTAVARRDIDPIPFLYWRMAERMCVALSFLNAQPYTTRAAVFAETRRFAILPASYELLIDAPDGRQEPDELARRAKIVFGEIEHLLRERGLTLYEHRLDAFVAPKPPPGRADLLKKSRLMRKMIGLGRRLGPGLIQRF